LRLLFEACPKDLLSTTTATVFSGDVSLHAAADKETSPRVLALRDVSFQIALETQWYHWPNGSGKSTIPEAYFAHH